MSKMDAMRAMREARYEQRPASGGGARAAAPKPVKQPATKAAAPAKPGSGADPADALCGHRSMNGRTCTREQGHAAKSHRYS